MTVYVALLRGLNVGGHNKLKMDALRAIAEGCGFGHVQTYIQSGNVVFSSRAGAAKVSSQLHDAILAESGIDSRVVVRTAAEIDGVLRDNPFLDRATVPKTLHVAFLYDEAVPTFDAVAPASYAPDEVVLGARDAYLLTPDGVGRSKLATESMMRKLGFQGTVRNWATVTTLAEMAAAMR